MMNKLRAIGLAVTGALLLLAGMVAIDAISGSNATTSSRADSSRGAPSVATIAFMPSDAATCAGCETTPERGLETLEMMSRDMRMPTEPSSFKAGQPYDSAEKACCADVPLSTRAVAGGAEEAMDTANSHVAYATSPTAQATAAVTRRHATNAVPALQEGAASNNHDRNSGSADSNSGVLASISPGLGIDTIPGAHEPVVIAPETGYCIDLAGAYCGDAGKPAATDDKPQTEPDQVVSPQATLLSGPSDSPETPDEPRSSPQIQELVHILPVPIEVPEPVTAMLFAIGLASMCTAFAGNTRWGNGAHNA